jgi:hypothetical protein
VRSDSAEHVRGIVEPLQDEALVEKELLNFRVCRNIIGIDHFQDPPSLASLDVFFQLLGWEARPG